MLPLLLIISFVLIVSIVLVFSETNTTTYSFTDEEFAEAFFDYIQARKEVEEAETEK